MFPTSKLYLMAHRHSSCTFLELSLACSVPGLIIGVSSPEHHGTAAFCFTAPRQTPDTNTPAILNMRCGHYQRQKVTEQEMKQVNIGPAFTRLFAHKEDGM